jgi:hypothetical protein
MGDEMLDEHEGEAGLKGRTEPPPEGRMTFLGAPYASPVPFGDAPSEPVKIVGEVPWELREADDEGADDEGAAAL